MFWALATAASLSAPAPLNYIFYSGDDMPAYHQMAGVTRITYIRLTVRPDATLQTCEVEDNGGDPKLGAFSCELAMQRARFAPARWIDGSPTYGVYRRTVTWAIDFPPPAKSLRGDNFRPITDIGASGSAIPLPSHRLESQPIRITTIKLAPFPVLLPAPLRASSRSRPRG